MKLIKSLIAASILATVAAGSASALTVDQATSSANVNLKVENGVATLWGSVDGNLDRAQAAYAASMIGGVEEVRNLLTYSN